MLPLSHNGSPVFFGFIMALPAELVKARTFKECGKKAGAALAMWGKEAYDKEQVNKGESVLPG